MRMLTREQQRTRQATAAMASIGLEAQLRLIVRDILSGNILKITEFHYWLRFAPPEMNERMLTFLHDRPS